MNCALLESEFAAVMHQLGPFPSRPRLTVAASGGADSTALALLAQKWVIERSGSLFTVIVDHGLRPGSDAEAELTAQRLKSRGMAARIVTLSGLGGTKLQIRARLARHAVLNAAAREAGCVFLLLGHHAGDQSETVAMRAKRGTRGLEGIPVWSARDDVVVLRPLLGIAPARLREYLRLQNMQWVEDPSNQDPRFERVRVRLAEEVAAPVGSKERRMRETDTAQNLARSTTIRPEGFALLSGRTVPPNMLAALIRAIGGAEYPPRREAVERLATALRPATLGGARILNAGKLGDGWLLVREETACEHPIPAKRGALWDSRFRLLEDVENGLCGATGPDSSMFRKLSCLPAAVVVGLPCIRPANASAAKPRLAKGIFTPPGPVAPLPFVALQPCS